MKAHVLAALSALVIAAGVAMIYAPAGVVVAGIEGLLAAYAVRYMEAHK